MADVCKKAQPIQVQLVAFGVNVVHEYELLLAPRHGHGETLEEIRGTVRNGACILVTGGGKI